uniref:Uncharacterized protein n=1 Tax=Knipowitschia caucasica TaxID=637954 RepID=A0AAV2MSC3_KNICA
MKGIWPGSRLTPPQRQPQPGEVLCVRAKQDTVCYYGNRASAEPVHLKPAGIYSLSNSLLDTPWKKLLQGKRHFTNVVSDHSLSSDGLVQELLNVLNNEELNAPDPVQELQGDGYSKAMIKALSAVCVRSPHYGTRTNTIVLIDAEGNVNFTERTMLNFAGVTISVAPRRSRRRMICAQSPIS